MFSLFITARFPFKYQTVPFRFDFTGRTLPS